MIEPSQSPQPGLMNVSLAKTGVGSFNVMVLVVEQPLLSVTITV